MNNLALVNGIRIFVYSKEIDMRSGFERLSYFITEELGMGLSIGDLFLFFSKNSRRLKVLFFDGTGLVLVTKRLEVGRFVSLIDLFERREISLHDFQKIFRGDNTFLSTIDIKFDTYLLNADFRENTSLRSGNKPGSS